MSENTNQKAALQLLSEIEKWNEGDSTSFDGSAVPFDGSFVFRAREKKLAALKELISSTPTLEVRLKKVENDVRHLENTMSRLLEILKKYAEASL